MNTSIATRSAPAPARSHAAPLPSPSALPKVGHAFRGGHFAGILTGPDGAPYALVLLPHQLASLVTWHTASDWARRLDGDLPSRCEAAMLLANFHRTLWGGGWTWTNETYHRESSYAWGFYGAGGRTSAEEKSTTALAFAVRRVPLKLLGIAFPEG